MARGLRRARFWLPLALAFAASAAHADSLQVSPVYFDLPAATHATELTLQNLGLAVVNAQIRVYRWSQEGGQDKLTETSDMVASPPAAALQANQQHLVRLVRTAAAPVIGEESYRVLVDQLPPAPDPNATSINFVVRYSIPVFFGDSRTAAKLTWSAALKDHLLTLSVQNSGNRHMQISQLTVTSASGAKLVFTQGLTGYVLAGASMNWSKTEPAGGGFAPGSTVGITGHGDNNRDFSATATLQSAD